MDRSDVARHLIAPNAPIVVTSWIPAAHIDFYMANRTGQETYGLGNIDSLHQYYWMNSYKKPAENVVVTHIIIFSSHRIISTIPLFDRVTNSFNSFRRVDMMFSQYRSGAVCKRFYIFRLLGFKGNQYFK